MSSSLLVEGGSGARPEVARRLRCPLAQAAQELAIGAEAVALTPAVGASLEVSVQPGGFVLGEPLEQLAGRQGACPVVGTVVVVVALKLLG